ncbi:MAG: Uracil-DNA glycosylase [Chlamydiales bacterium]|nr:Uracil-DNA glycosylase [Chlamydiales bacterium]
MQTLAPPQLDENWRALFREEWSKEYMFKLVDFVRAERQKFEIYPPQDQIFNAFNHTAFDKVKVVMMGQDPYHGAHQAHGLSFSVPQGVPKPPSLKNIFKELQADLGITPPVEGSLLSWADQGVLLLNATLTVRAGAAKSHHGHGWEHFTDVVIKKLCLRTDPVIFVLWGKSAQEKCKHILAKTENRHFVLTAPHPSPLSAHTGFFGCRHFSKINELLTKQGKEPINWVIS